MLVWRPHRLLRRRIGLPLSISARQPTAPHTPLSISGFRVFRTQTSVAAAEPTQDSQGGFSSFTPPANRNDLASWIGLIEPLLPGRLRNPPQKDDKHSTLPAEDRVSALGFIISQARSQSNHDLLVHLALQQGRWDTMLWVANALIESCNARPPFALGPFGFSTVAWPEDKTLESITLLPFCFENDSSHPLAYAKSLNKMASKPHSNLINVAQTKADLAIGQVWQSLGGFVAHAASCEVAERNHVMLNVLRVLASLNKHRFIPDALYTSTPTDTDDPLAPEQSYPFQKLSREMLTSLTDNTFDLHATDQSCDSDSIQASKFLASNRPSRTVAPSALRFSTGHWLEFILWCCVHGQWIIEGASIITEIRKAGGRNKWSMVCWGDHGKLESVDSAIKPTLSAEVVVALVDGLMATSPIRGDPMAPSVVTIVDKIFVLKKILDRDNMGLGFSTWDAIIARFADSPALLSLERNPAMMEIVLGLAESYGKEPKSRNAVSSNLSGSGKAPKAYIFDASAAVIGLYHRTLHAYIRSRDVDGALRVWGRLQALTDTNKARSLREFFARLVSIRAPTSLEQYGGLRGLRRHIRALFPRVEFPAYFPEIPKPIVADLLDLMVESGNLEVASWMVYATDLDGPLVPETLYADQVVAPSLIRYAAVANDIDLLKRLSRAETARLSGKTLVALCDNRIRNANFPAALDVLAMINDYSLHQWTVFDLATLVKSLILQIFGLRNCRDVDDPVSQHAAAVLQRLLRGDLGQVWGTSFAQLDTVVGILSSLDSYLRDLCSEIVKSGENFRIDLPTGSFNVLLEGITRVWGCRKGKEVYSDWCSYQKDRQILDLKGFVSDSTDRLPTVLELFSVPKQLETPDVKPEETTILFRGSITPDIASVRVIVQEALKQVQNDSQDQLETPDTSPSVPMDENPAHEVLQWAQKTLSETYGLSDIDVDYELQGYFSPHQGGPVAQDLYSRQTLQIWRAFAGSYRAWALEKENELRLFAVSKTERQIVLDPQSPAERLLLHCLANDYGLLTELLGDEPEASVRVFKAGHDPRIPLKTVDEALERGVSRWE